MCVYRSGLLSGSGDGGRRVLTETEAWGSNCFLLFLVAGGPRRLCRNESLGLQVRLSHLSYRLLMKAEALVLCLAPPTSHPWALIVCAETEVVDSFSSTLSLLALMTGYSWPIVEHIVWLSLKLSKNPITGDLSSHGNGNLWSPCGSGVQVLGS